MTEPTGPDPLAASGPHAGTPGAAAAGGRLTIDLAALRDNYRRLAAAAAPAGCAAVVKADAYGLGVAVAVPALLAAGCRCFFVADVNEAAAAAPLLPGDATLYVLGGAYPGGEAMLAATGALPVLNTLSQARRWQACAERAGGARPAALQVDTGMSRLGMAADELRMLAADAAFRRAVPLTLVMSHLAAADCPGDRANAAQRAAFASACATLPGVPRSLANSAATLTAGEYRCDLVRPGIALYGGAPFADRPNPMRPVVSLDARVMQVRTIAEGTGVGYGLTFVAPGPRRIATVGVGYADGWPRRLGGIASAWAAGALLPIVGRVSMDSMAVDVTALASKAVGEGDWLELIGPHRPIDAVAAEAGTIAYEILTALGRRYDRRIVGAPEA